MRNYFNGCATIAPQPAPTHTPPSPRSAVDIVRDIVQAGDHEEDGAAA